MTRILLALFVLASALLAQTKDSAPREFVELTYSQIGSLSDKPIIVKCTDCTATNPCAGSGSGAFARREAGAWNCGGGTGTSLPTQTGNSGKLLTTNGTDASWGDLSIEGMTKTGLTFSADGTFAEPAGNNNWTGHSYYPASATQNITAVSNTILCNQRTVAISADAEYTLTSAPTIADGTDGQVCVIQNVGTYNVILQDQDTLASSNLQLSASTVTIPPKGQIRLQYSSTVGDWVQEGSNAATVDVSKMVTTKYCKASGWSAVTSQTVGNVVGTITITGIAPYGMIKFTEAISKTGTAQTFSTRLKIGTLVTPTQASSSTDKTFVYMTRQQNITLVGTNKQLIIGNGVAFKAGSASPASGLNGIGDADVSGVNPSLAIEVQLWRGNEASGDTVTHEFYCVEYIPPAS